MSLLDVLKTFSPTFLHLCLHCQSAQVISTYKLNVFLDIYIFYYRSLPTLVYPLAWVGLSDASVCVCMSVL